MLETHKSPELRKGCKNCLRLSFRRKKQDLRRGLRARPVSPEAGAAAWTQTEGCWEGGQGSGKLLAPWTAGAGDESYGRRWELRLPKGNPSSCRDNAPGKLFFFPPGLTWSLLSPAPMHPGGPHAYFWLKWCRCNWHKSLPSLARQTFILLSVTPILLRRKYIPKMEREFPNVEPLMIT